LVIISGWTIKYQACPTIVILKGLCHQRLMTGLFRFTDRFCTTLWGGLQRIFNQICHILGKPMIKPGMTPLAKAGFSGHHAVVKMADFGLIDWFHCSALTAVIVAAMPVFWRIFQPDLTGQYFANTL
jgi:hypothetical protein